MSAVPSRPRRADRTASLAHESVGGAAYVEGQPLKRQGQAVRSSEEFYTVKRLAAQGLNDCAIARLTGVPRRTVRDLRCRPSIRPRNVARSSGCSIEHDFESIAAAPYCYLLGLYLGDGCISRSGRVWHLRVTLDKTYPAIIARCRQAIDMLMPGPARGNRK